MKPDRLATLKLHTLSFAVLCACSAKGLPDADSAPPLECRSGSRWTAGTSAFERATESWGLVGVHGNRLSVTDIDGDGWADLLVRNWAGPDDFSEGGNRYRWVLRNTGHGSFEDVTESSGLLVGRANPDPLIGRAGQVFASADVDGDGDLDVFVGTSRQDPNDVTAEASELMLNQGDGTFVLGDVDSEARMTDRVSNPAGVTFTDVNLDGHLDLWIVQNDEGGTVPLQDALFLGDGQGGFEDATRSLGLQTSPWNNVATLNAAEAHSWGWSGAACDLNDDGIPELLASSYGRSLNHLWQGRWDNGDVQFDNASISSGYASDHRTDWTTNINAQCYCADYPNAEDCDLAPEPDDPSLCTALRNSFGGNYRWNHAYGREPFQLGGNSGATVCADIDNDGDIDLMTTEIVHFDVGDNSDPSELLVNQGSGSVVFERPGGEVTGLTRVDEYEHWDRGDMSAAVFDFDNDGWQDIYIGATNYAGNRGLLYHQASARTFEEMPREDYFEHYRSHGVAVADFDRDGDLDVVVGHDLNQCEGTDDCDDTPQIQLFENKMGDASNWLQLALEGVDGTNTSAIGARVAVTAGGVTQTQEVDGGHGHFGTQRDLVLHFGLGEACEADVTIIWPNAERSQQSFTLASSARYSVVQGQAPERDD